MQRDLLNIRPARRRDYRDLAARAVPVAESLPASQGRGGHPRGVIFALLHHSSASRRGAVAVLGEQHRITRLLLTPKQVRLLSINDTAHLEGRLDLHAH
jgi:hypothetical protein